MTTRKNSTGEPQLAGLLLAAGEGQRLGRPKALVELAGERLVDRGVRVLREGGCVPIYVVTGAAPAEVSETVAVHNPAWSEGLGSSLRAGLDAMPEDVDAVLVALVDQPLVSTEAVRRLANAYAEGERAIVATYVGNPRNPVLLGREHWPSVHAMAEGDVGARPFLRAYSHLVTPVACDDVASSEDIDTPDDLERMRARVEPAEQDTNTARIQ
ncbi:nicotine blue oxidoreductase [Lipingzhangella halophila]|uniref:Nicotine blue oxidoreductase n=1 Tax=Lipingzhangella halophila TaxID=1783352 RepID=A0A7W7RFI4_9ACTN|nr:nucleotidyltransferase family protein [Lipingzhangella halophila]MBB4930920.1 nicotine blue oxidoreductase [Lipingzhangella halophila]